MIEFWGAKARPFIEHHFSMFLLGAFVVGLFIPDISFIPRMIVPVVLAAIIFVSCSKIRLDDFKQMRARDVAGFLAVRFLLLPVLIFYTAQAFVPEYKYALLLLGLLPCGVTLAALMSIVGGSAALGLTATTITSLLAPLLIPVAFMWFSNIDMDVDAIGMFKMLLFMIVLPVVLYFGFARRFEPVKLSLRRNSSALSCLLICVNIIIVVSYQQDKFFENFGFLFWTFLIGVVCYVIFYALGWFFFRKAALRHKISYALMSGNNNINLGISLAVLFLPDFESLIMVLWEINWILGLVCFQYFVRRRTDFV